MTRKPRQITMARMSAIARQTDPLFWNRLTPAERRELLGQFNAAQERETDADAAAGLIARTLRPSKRNRK